MFIAMHVLIILHVRFYCRSTICAKINRVCIWLKKKKKRLNFLLNSYE